MQIEPDPVDVLQRLYPPLRRAARTLVGDQDGEDLVQAALVEVLAHHPGWSRR